jgi:hypothetical protein
MCSHQQYGPVAYIFLPDGSLRDDGVVGAKVGSSQAATRSAPQGVCLPPASPGSSQSSMRAINSSDTPSARAHVMQFDSEVYSKLRRFIEVKGSEGWEVQGHEVR